MADVARVGVRTGKPGVGRRENARVGERGVLVVEAAFAFPIVILLTFGIIEFGMLFGNVSTTGAAARSGARVASTDYARSGDRATTADQVAQVVLDDLDALSRGAPIETWIYEANSGRPSICATSTSCIRYVYNPTTRDWGTASGGWSDPDACGTTVDTVGVLVVSRHPYLTRMFGGSRIIREYANMRLEPLPTDQCS